MLRGALGGTRQTLLSSPVYHPGTIAVLQLLIDVEDIIDY